MLIKLPGRIRARRAVLKVHGDKKTLPERVCHLAYILLSLSLEVSAVGKRSLTQVDTTGCSLDSEECMVPVGMLVEEFLILEGSPRANRVSLHTSTCLSFRNFKKVKALVG